MVNQAVDCRGRGQGILEDPLPVREDQVAGQQNRATMFAAGGAKAYFQRGESSGTFGQALHEY